MLVTGAGPIDVDRLVTGHYPLADAEASLTVGRRDPASVKVMVHPGS